MRKKKFLRRNTGSLSKLGKLRKKLQKWRSPKGRDNKMRLREKGRPRTVEIGYKQNDKVRNKIDGKETRIVNNLNDLNKVKKNEIALLGKVGRKKKIEIAKAAKKQDVVFNNFNVNKFMKLENKSKQVKEKKE